MLRSLWPLADPPTRFSWSNGIYSDPPTLVHAARNAMLFHDWITDYNRDLYVYPLMNALTWVVYQPDGPSRLATVMLAVFAGVATIAAVAAGLWRAAGPRAAALGALLGAVDFWLVGFSRIPVAENVVVALLAWSAFFALSSGWRALAVSGSLAVAAVLFGKYHAVGALPGLAAFLLLRNGGVSRAWPWFAGGGAVALVWFVAVFLPERETILGHVAAQSTGLHGRLPLQVSPREGLLEPFNTLRRSWMFYRMPIVAALAAFFLFWTVGFRAARRRHIANGTAIWAFWLLSMWLYLSLLSYKAPRYYVLVGAPLVAAAAATLDRLLERGIAWRRPRGFAEAAAVVAFAFTFSFGAIDAAKHYASMALEYLSLPPPRISEGFYDFLYDVFGNVDTFYQNLAWAGAFAAVAVATLFVGARTGGNGVRPWHTFVGVSCAASVAFALAQYGWYAAHRSRYLEEVKESLPRMLGPGPVLLGPMAPLVAQDTEWRALPYYGPPGRPELLHEFGVTHVVVCGSGEARQLEDRFPGLLDRTILVQSWPVQTLFSSTLEVRRLPPAAESSGVAGGSYAPTAFELGSQAVFEERWQDALDHFEEFRATGGREMPELLSLESVCWFTLGDLEKAEALLTSAIRERPGDPLNYQNLAVLDLKRGDRASALENLLKAIRIDPHSPQLDQMIQELTR